MEKKIKNMIIAIYKQRELYLLAFWPALDFHLKMAIELTSKMI